MSRLSSVTPAQQTVSSYLSLCCGNALTRTRTRVRTSLDSAMRLHSVVLGGEAGQLLERRGDALAVALAVIALVAKERHGAGELVREAREKLTLRGEVAIEIPEESLIAAVLAKLVTDVARRSQVALVAVRDAGAREVLGKRGLGEPLASGDRKLADIEERGDAECGERRDEIRDRCAFVTDGEEALHERDPCERLALCVRCS